jgi:ABC-2 type transport system permease protein
MRGKNIYYLGCKELMSLWRDPILIGFIVFAFTVTIYVAAMAESDTLHKATISIVDEDQSELSKRIIELFHPPYFNTPNITDLHHLDERMNASLDSFSIIIPIHFERDVLAGKRPAIQLNIDATRISQALTGNKHIQQLILDEIGAFLQKQSLKGISLPVDISYRVLFNPDMNVRWYGGLRQLIDIITLLSIVLSGAALIREREYGTVEHLLVMPVTSFEIMLSKIWPIQLVVLVLTFFSLEFVIKLVISMPIEGSVFLFMIGVFLVLFATSSLGIFLGTFARSMPQFALILIMIVLPLQILSGTVTPRESMPTFIQNIMLITPNTNFVMLSQSILYRGAGLEAVWPQFLYLFLIGAALFLISLSRFRSTLSFR